MSINRRLLVAGAMLGWLGSACAASPRRAVSIRKVLERLPSMSKGSELIARLGPPEMDFEFTPGDKNARFQLQQLTRESLARISIESHAGLIDTLPLQSRMVTYFFTFRPDRSGVGLTVCLDDADKIIGWMYDKSYPGRETSIYRLPEEATGFEE
jgi:hypothetical protein